jgi:hypothetical protein
MAMGLGQFKTFLRSRWQYPLWPGESEVFDRPIMLPERGPATADAAIPAPVLVDVNTLVVRTDLGANRFTFVAANTAVPAGLEGFARILA